MSGQHRRRIVRANSNQSQPPTPQQLQQIAKLQSRIDKEEQTLQCWFRRFKRAFGKVDRTQKTLARLQRQLRKLQEQFREDH